MKSLKGQFNNYENLVSQVLEQQSCSTAYRRGVSAVSYITLGMTFVSPKAIAIARGYPSHSQENRLFVEGFLDTLQDNGITIHTDEFKTVTAIVTKNERFETVH